MLPNNRQKKRDFAFVDVCSTKRIDKKEYEGGGRRTVANAQGRGTQAQMLAFFIRNI